MAPGLQWTPADSVGLPGIGKPVRGGMISIALLLAALSATEAVAQVTTVTVGGATNSSEYSIKVVDDQTLTEATISYTSDGSATAAEICAGLLAAAEANSLFGGLVAVASPTSTTLTLTGHIGGASQTFTVSFPANPSTQLTQAATTAAADAPTYYLGKFVKEAGASATNPKIGAITARTAATLAYTITHGAGATYSGIVTVNDPRTGDQRSVSWSASAGANAAATYAAVNAALVTAFSFATGSTVVTASNVVTVSFPAPWGAPLEISTSASGGGGSPAMTAAATNASVPEVFHLVCQSNDWAPYRGQDPLALLPQDGRSVPVPVVWAGRSTDWRVQIASSETPTVGAAVYIETAAGANLGRATGTPSPTTAILPGAVWAPGTTTGVGVVTIP